MLTRIHTAAFVVATLFASPTAFASSDHFIEFQMSTAKFAEMVHGGFVGRTRDFCPQVGACPTGGTCVLDHVEIGGLGSFSRAPYAASIPVNGHTSVSAQPVLFHQEATYYSQTEACSFDPDCDVENATTVQATYRLEADSEGRICLLPVGVSPAVIGIPTPVPPRCFGIDEGYLASYTGAGTHVVSGAALSMDAAMSRVAVRYELDRVPADYDTNRVNAWNAFLQGTLSTPEATDWSVFVHASTFRDQFVRQVQEGMAGYSALSLSGPITTSWTSLGKDGATLAASVPAVVSSSVLPCPNDVHVAVGFTMTLAKNEDSNGFSMSGTLTMDPSDGDASACAASYGLLGFMAVPLINLGVLDNLVSNYLLPQISQGISDCPVVDNTFSCDLALFPRLLWVGPGLASDLSLTGVEGRPTGLALAGAATDLPNHVYTADVTEFPIQFGLGSSCYASTCQYRGGVSIVGSARLCGVDFGDDPENVYEVVTQDLPTVLPTEIEVTVNPNATAQDIADFNADPYPLVVRVATSQGMKAYEVELDKVMNNDEASVACTTQKVLQFVRCNAGYVGTAQQPWEYWICDPFHMTQQEVLMGFIDARNRTIASGVGFDPRIETVRNVFGVVTSASLVVDVVSHLTTSTPRSVPVSVPIQVPASYTGSDTQLARDFLAGTNTRQHVAPQYLPSTVPSADVEVRSTSPDLLKAVLATMSH